MTTTRGVLSGVVAQGGRLGMQGVAQLLVGIIIARVLGVPALGVYAFVTSVVAIATIVSDMGVTLYLSAEVARDRSHVRRYVSALLVPAIGVGTVLGAAVALIISRGPALENLGIAAAASAIVVLTSSVGNVLRGAIYAFQRFDYEFYSVLLQEGLLIASVVALLLTGAGLTEIFGAFLLSRVLGFALLGWLYHTRIESLDWRTDVRTVREVFRGAIPYTVNGIATVVSHRADTVLLYWLMGPGAAGVYEAAANVSFRLAVVFPRVFANALLPSLIANGVPLSSLRGLVAPTALIGVVIAIPLVLFAEPLFQSVYGADTDGGGLIRILALGIPMHFVSLLLATLLTAGQQQPKRTASVTASALISVVALVALVPMFGVLAGASAIVLSQVALLVLLLAYARPTLARVRTERRGPPHVAIVVRQFGPPWNEGVRNLAREVESYLVDRGVRTSVITSRWGPGESTRGRYKVPGGILRFPIAAGLQARELGANVVLFFSDHSLAAGPKIWTLRQLSGARVVVYVPGVRHVHAGKMIVRRIATLLLPHDRVRFVVGSRYLQRFVPEATFLPPWTRLERPVKSRAGGRRQNVVFLGTLERGRGVLELLEAIAILRKRAPEAQLLIAWNGHGSDQKHRLDRRTDELGLRDAVRFLDVSKRADAYELADVVVIPHVSDHYMAFPLRILEAAESGRPLVVTTVCAMDESAGEAALSVPPRDPVAMADAIRRLLQDDETYERCRRAGFELYRRHDPEETLARLTAWLEGGPT